ncbi:MAG: winged helix-turn-helix domain-containing protein [Methanolinea sp.]|jgi:DNA-binding transcriptional ArsR family regulator|nr:winged helix-turn-helix transcriptional regulator [Methanolinea sp.]
MDTETSDSADTGTITKNGEVLVLQPGDERAQKIGKAIASQSATDILNALQERPKTAGDLTSSLNMPMGTVKYHLENLVEAGLVEVRQIRYSVKGREIKVYGLKDQLLIVAPRVQNIRSILLKYATLFAVVILATFAAYSMSPLLSSDADTGAGFGRDITATYQAEKGTGTLVAPSPATGIESSMASAPIGTPFDPFLAFFLGGCLVILILLLYEALTWRKHA